MTRNSKTHTHARIHTRTHTHARARTHTHAHAHTRARTHAQAHKHAAGIDEIAEPDASAAVYPALFFQY